MAEYKNVKEFVSAVVKEAKKEGSATIDFKGKWWDSGRVGGNILCIVGTEHYNAEFEKEDIIAELKKKRGIEIEGIYSDYFFFAPRIGRIIITKKTA